MGWGGKAWNAAASTMDIMWCLLRRLPQSAAGIKKEIAHAPNNPDPVKSEVARAELAQQLGANAFDQLNLICVIRMKTAKALLCAQKGLKIHCHSQSIYRSTTRRFEEAVLPRSGIGTVRSAARLLGV